MANLITSASDHQIHVDYDRDSDVLYIALGNPVAAVGDYVDGIIYRFSETTDEPCGVTVVGFKENKWDKKVTVLAKDIATHLHIKSDDLLSALSKV